MKKILNKIKSLDKGTIYRTVLMVVTGANQIVALVGNTTFASSSIYQWISLALTLVMMIVTYWFNNDWSKLAMLSRDVLDALKDGKITKEEVEKMLEHKETEVNENVSK